MKFQTAGVIFSSSISTTASAPGMLQRDAVLRKDTLSALWFPAPIQGDHPKS